MIIRKYGDRPQVFVPDIGEVIQGRVARDDALTSAVVTNAYRRRNGMIKLTVQWLADDPDASTPITAGQKGWIEFWPADMWMLVRQTEAPASPGASGPRTG